jgi:hypothetical protein
MRSRDEFEEIADDEGRDELVTEITLLYEQNLLNPSIIGMELEKILRTYLETADGLLDAQSEIEAQMMEDKLDELDGLVAALRVAYAQEANA